MKNNLVKNLVKFTITVFLLYILLGLILFVFQNNFLYHPSNSPFNDCIWFNEEETKFVGEETRIYHRDYESDNLAIIFHGNAGRACDRNYLFNILDETQTSYIILEYPGFGGDSKSPNENKIYSQVDKVLSYSKNYSEDFIFIGESLGNFFASYSAQKLNEKNKTVNSIHISPFKNIKDIAQDNFPIYPTRYLLQSNLDNKKYLKETQFKNSLVIGGSNDQIVSENRIKEFYSLINSKNVKDKYIHPQAGHNDLFLHSEVKDRIKEFVEKTKS